MMQPPILMNRFIINLRALSAASGSPQDTSVRQHWSRFSVPNFYIPDSKSFLGNIGADLQDGHEPTDSDLCGHNEMDAVCFEIESSPGAELKKTSTTPGSSTSCLMDAQVSVQIHSGIVAKYTNQFIVCDSPAVANHLHPRPAHWHARPERHMQCPTRMEPRANA